MKVLGLEKAALAAAKVGPVEDCIHERPDRGQVAFVAGHLMQANENGRRHLAVAGGILGNVGEHFLGPVDDLIVVPAVAGQLVGVEQGLAVLEGDVAPVHPSGAHDAVGQLALQPLVGPGEHLPAVKWIVAAGAGHDHADLVERPLRAEHLRAQHGQPGAAAFVDKRQAAGASVLFVERVAGKRRALIRAKPEKPVQLVLDPLNVVPFDHDDLDPVVGVGRLGGQSVGLTDGQVRAVIEQVAHDVSEPGRRIGRLDEPELGGEDRLGVGVGHVTRIPVRTGRVVSMIPEERLQIGTRSLVTVRGLSTLTNVQFIECRCFELVIATWEDRCPIVGRSHIDGGG